MFQYVRLDETQVDAVKSAIESFYTEKFGEIPTSLVHAVALEAVAAEIREKCAAEESLKAKMPTLTA